MSVVITGGMSSRRTIAIQSDRFRSRATCSRDGNIDCTVTPLTKLEQFEYAHRNLPIPRVLWYAMFLVCNIKRRTWFWLAPLAVLVYGADWYVHRYYPAPPSQAGTATINQLVFALLGGLLLAYYTLVFVARWHGAEHMTIAAYRKHGSANPDDVSKESPAIGSCGGRFLVPVIVAQLLASFLLRRYMPTLAAEALGLEIMLWVDKFWGLDRVPVFAQVTFLLQKYVTTRAPGDLELQTAQRALQELVAAHG